MDGREQMIPKILNGLFNTHAINVGCSLTAWPLIDISQTGHSDGGSGVGGSGVWPIAARARLSLAR